MSIQLVTGFIVNNSTPLDNRIVASGSAARNAIPYKYEGMRVYDSQTGFSYVWTNNAFQDEKTTQINGTVNYVPKFTSQYYTGNSNIISDSFGRVGIGVAPTGESTYLQIGDSTGSNLPFLIHRGGSTVLGHNWYYTSALGEQAFNASLGSTTLLFGQAGDVSLKVRQSSTTFANQKQAIYISQTGNVGIGNVDSTFGISSPPSQALDVRGSINVTKNINASINITAGGTVSASYIFVSNSGSSNRPSTGIILFDSSPNLGSFLLSPPANGNSLSIDFAGNVPGDVSYYATIHGNSQGYFGGDLVFRTTDTSQSIPNYTSLRPARMIIKNTGFVGIGTQTPTDLLQVNGTASVTVLKVSNGSAASPAINFASSTLKTGIYSPGNNRLEVIAGDQQKVSFTDKDFFANIHNISGGGTASYLLPTISSGEYIAGVFLAVNCGIDPTYIQRPNWMRVGNVVTVSGQISVDPMAAGACSFELALPVEPAFSISSPSINNAWRLNGTGVMYYSLGGCVSVRITGVNTLRAKFVFSVTASQLTESTMAFIFQYNMDLANIVTSSPYEPGAAPVP